MMPERMMLDTMFVQAIISRRDQFHQAVQPFIPRMESAEVWITEAVLLEIGNALSGINREGAADFIRRSYTTPNIKLIPIDTALLIRGLELYENRADKEWSLTDCISFVVMQDNGI